MQNANVRSLNLILSAGGEENKALGSPVVGRLAFVGRGTPRFSVVGR